MFPLMVGPSQSSNRYGSVKRQAPKTQNAYRKVDLAPELAEMLKGYLGPLRGGFIFANGNGNPLSQTNVVRRKLHPILKDLGITKQGFHGTRRFRATWLRKQMAPEDLIKFWLGRAGTGDSLWAPFAKAW